MCFCVCDCVCVCTTKHNASNAIYELQFLWLPLGCPTLYPLHLLSLSFACLLSTPRLPLAASSCPLFALLPPLRAALVVVVDITNFASYLHICEHIIVQLPLACCPTLSLPLFPSLPHSCTLSLSLSVCAACCRLLCRMCKDAQNILRPHSAQHTAPTPATPTLQPPPTPLSLFLSPPSVCPASAVQQSM